MKLHKNQFPEEGMAEASGVSEGNHLDLAGEDWRQEGPLEYALQLGRDGGAFWVSGTLKMPVRATCVRCLRPFPFVAAVHEFAAHIDQNETAKAEDFIDLTQTVREEIILALPIHPDCAAHGGAVCPGVKITGTVGALEDENHESADSRWSALERVILKKPGNAG